MSNEWISFDDAVPEKGQIILIKAGRHSEGLNSGIFFARSNWSLGHPPGEKSYFHSVSVINGSFNPGRSGCIFLNPCLTDEIRLEFLRMLDVKWRNNPIS